MFPRVKPHQRLLTLALSVCCNDIYDEMMVYKRNEFREKPCAANIQKKKERKTARQIVWTDDQSGFRDLLRMNVERFNHLLQLVPPYMFLNETPN